MPTLSLTRCSKVYSRPLSRRVVRALDDVSLEIGRGSVTALLGPNGAGKTTLIKCVCGLVTPTSGNIWVNGTEVGTGSRGFLVNISAMLEGSRNIYWNLTPAENLRYFANLRGLSTSGVRARITELLEGLDLEDKRDEPVGRLSRGMQQKVALAVALLPAPPLLLLDEPTLGLDPFSAQAVKDRIRALQEHNQSAVLLTTHDLRVAEDISDEVAVLDRGRLVERAKLSELRQRYRSRAYELVIKGQLQQRHCHRLAQFGEFRHLSSASITRVHIKLGMADSIADVVSIVNAFGADVLSVNQEAPDLEEILIGILRGGVENHNANDSQHPSRHTAVGR